MAALLIPEEYKDGMATLLELEDAAIDDLVSALENAPLAMNYKTLSERTAPNISSIPREDVDDILEILVSLYVVRANADVPVPEFITDICEAMDESDDVRLNIPAEKRYSFMQRLLRLFSVNALSVAAKARSVLINHEHALCSTRMFTDIRPVFGEHADASPLAAVLIHTLKIKYHHGNYLKEFFVAMDTEDLTNLKQVIERAEKKAASLKSVIDAAKLPYVDAE